MLKLRCLHSLS